MLFLGTFEKYIRPKMDIICTFRQPWTTFMFATRNSQLFTKKQNWGSCFLQRLNCYQKTLSTPPAKLNNVSLAGSSIYKAKIKSPNSKKSLNALDYIEALKFWDKMLCMRATQADDNSQLARK